MEHLEYSHNLHKIDAREFVTNAEERDMLVFRSVALSCHEHLEEAS